MTKRKLTDEKVKEVYEWYMIEDRRTIDDAAVYAGVYRLTLMREFKRAGFPSKNISDHLSRRRGAETGTWKGGRVINGEGYVLVTINEDDPFYSMTFANKRYVFEHRYVMAQNIGRPLHDWETVHHIDGDRTNNDISNLQLRIGKHGKGQTYVCMDCGSHRVEPVELV